MLRRADGFIAYHLATAVDELALGITDVVRGGDLAPVCRAQQAVIAVLAQSPPRYRHVPLLCDAAGQKLSKREQAQGLEPLQEQGLTAEQVLGRLAASLNLVPEGSALSASELQQHLQQRPQLLQDCLQTLDS